MKETIIAAAIRYEGLVCALPRPARHHHVIKALSEVPNIRIPVDKEQGFVTSTGRFVGRDKAAEIALASGQLRFLNRSWLASEDLW